MGKSSGPRPPSPKALAASQMATNITTGTANNLMGMVNQYGPGGQSLTYQQTGTQSVTDPVTGKTFEVPQYSATYRGGEYTGLTAIDRNKADFNLARAASQLSENARPMLSQPFSTARLPDRMTAPDRVYLAETFGDAGPITKTYGTDFSADRQRVEDALMQRMQPQIDRDREELRTRLANQGIDYGSQAYGAAMDDFGRTTNDARLGAILAGGQEQSRLTGLEAQRAGFENAAQAQQFGQNMGTQAFRNEARLGEFGSQLQSANLREQQRAAAMGEDVTARTLPMQQIASMLQGARLGQPGFQMYQPAGMPNTDYAGLAMQRYQQEAANAAAQNQARSGLFGNILGAAGTLGAAFLSDRRLKRDIRQIGQRGPLRVYEYRYAWDAPGTVRRGYMAQEVLGIVPAAVLRIGDWLALDYAQLPEVG